MILGFMRVKSEQRWIARVIESMLPLCEKILILDDNSTDDTVHICRQFPQVTVFESPFEGTEETRDKNHLLEKLEEVAKRGDWVIAIDGDEVLAPGSQEKIQRLTTKPMVDAYRFKVLYLWDRPNQVRQDGIYGRFTRPSMFKLQPGARFKSHCAGGFHCGNVPGPPPNVKTCDVELLHYGYMERADRIRKWNWYSSLDPHNVAEGYDPRFPERKNYPHVVQGDVPEVPAHVRLRHAGPLELRAL